MTGADLPDIIIRRRTPEERARWQAERDAARGRPLFHCLICQDAVYADAWDYLGKKKQRGPICHLCTRRWGTRNAGPVFNRANYWAIGQLKAMTNRLQWEIKNGRR